MYTKTLQAFTILLQENSHSKQINRKTIDIVAQCLEDRIRVYMKGNLNKMSMAAKSIVANQKELQLSTPILVATTEFLHQRLLRTWVTVWRKTQPHQTSFPSQSPLTEKLFSVQEIGTHRQPQQCLLAIKKTSSSPENWTTSKDKSW